MNKILYTARYLLPITAPPIEDGALLVMDGNIVKVGSRKELLPAAANGQVVDFGDSVLLPPLVNAHTHLELTHVAEWAAIADATDAPQNFVDWILWLVRVRRSVDEAQLRTSLEAGLNRSLLAGTGAVGDILTTLSASAAYALSPMRGKVFAEVLGQDVKDITARLADISTAVEDFPAGQMLFGLSPHTTYTLSGSAMQAVVAYAQERRLQKAVHVAESAEETSFLKDGVGQIASKLYPAAQWNSGKDRISGFSPVKAMLQAGYMRTGDVVVHGVQVDDEDIQLLKNAGCSVALCPRSNAKLDVGKAPVDKYLQAGVPLALGTDSLASAPSLSMWEEIAFARDWFDNGLTPSKWLEMATFGGVKALGLEKSLGLFRKGDNASFQVVTLSTFPNIAELEDALSLAAQDVKVSHLFLAGQNVLS